ncbi:capsule biosynthesis GfcC family protein [Vibrio hippocampi]|uniref:Capsule biosynthesis GfcC family protein n=1 Tax=Vibrio hippocampi TaxID=654686 RepID=A0ABN8DM02_9VIBR|nr:capsule biosynthesis GfcC family protein [Vibrio hippocampi]CAH0527241.1 hypothetical protein VHP8226_02569 [Vibrio hippocampi]
MHQGSIRLLRLAIPLLSLVFPVSAASLKVNLPQQQVSFDYQQPTSLEQLLGDVHQRAVKEQPDRSVWQYVSWQAQLFDLTKQAEIESQKQAVLMRLQQLQNEYPNSGAKSILNQLQAMKFKSRQWVSLDFDDVQSQLDANPILAGQFELNLFPRDNSVYFLGAVKKPQSLSHKARWFLSDYFEHIGSVKLDAASGSYALVVQPTGEVQIAQYGIWNFQPHFIAPGALVWVPFDNLPSDYQSLNADIAQLLSNKVSYSQ